MYQNSKVAIAFALLALLGFRDFAGGMVTGWFANDIPVFLENMSLVLITSMGISKYVNYTYNHSQMRNLTFIMAEDWNIYSNSSQEEYDILCKCYMTGKKIAIYYAAILAGLMLPFTFTPGVLNIASFMGLYNMSQERILMFPSQYFIDVDKYYYHLLVHGHLATIGYVILVIGLDSMLVFYVQHESALCEILGYRLERITEAVKVDLNFNADNKNDIEYLNAKTCVIMHNHIIEYAKYLEDANNTSYLFQLGFIMTGITLAIFQAVVQLNQPREAFRYITFVLCMFCILYLESWPGQQLWDCTERIFEFTANSKWYDFSPSVKKLINTMLLRSSQPLKITAGKLYLLNLQNFSAVARTSFSYFTVLRSVQ